jgi:signal transduction histidine kinase
MSLQLQPGEAPEPAGPEVAGLGRGSDHARQTQIIRSATLAICAIGAVSIHHHWRLGFPDMCLALVLAMAAGLGNLALLHRTRRTGLCGHLALVALTGFLLYSSLRSGGFRDPSFSWFYLLPLTAAVFAGLRGAAIWLVVTLGITVGLWSLEASGVVIADRIPVEMRSSHALFNRLTAIVGLSLVASSFVISQRRAERRLAATNAELRRESAYVRLLEHAAVAANEAATLDEAMQEAVGRICTAMGWPVGHVYVLGDDGLLRTSGVFYVEDSEHFDALREKTLRTAFRSGEGLPGRALVSLRPEAFYSLPERSSRPRAGLAHRLGLNTAFAIPVTMHGRAAAVLEFGARERMAPDLRLVEVLACVGVQIGRVAERAALQQRVRQSQKLEAVGRLAAGIAHEINNPMAYMRSNLSQLRSGWASLRGDLEKLDEAAPLLARLDECEELIDDSLEGVDRTAAIVRDMKEFSHEGESQLKPADLGEIVDSAMRVAAAHAPAGVQLEHRDEDELPLVSCAANQLHQVLVNLVVNAIEAVGGAGRVRVAARSEGAAVVLRIEDDGPGMSDDTRDRLFDPFFTTKPAGEGTGLGLAISYEIVRNHGGEIRARPAERGGTVMEVRLPRNDDPAPPREPPANGG